MSGQNILVTAIQYNHIHKTHYICWYCN
jgi:hypothetical protein